MPALPILASCLLAGLLLLPSSCTNGADDDSGSSSSSGGGNVGPCGSEFCDGLKFGHAMSGFQLSGESTTFDLSETTGTVYFRLESQADFSGRFVRLYINYASTNTPYGQKDYTLPQSYGHITLSSFRITDQGTYDVKAYLVTNAGVETHVTTSTLTMVP